MEFIWKFPSKRNYNKFCSLKNNKYLVHNTGTATGYLMIEYHQYGKMWLKFSVKSNQGLENW